MTSATSFEKPALRTSCLTISMRGVAESPDPWNFLKCGWARDSTDSEAWQVVPPKEPAYLWTTPKAREELPGPRRDLSKASLSTRFVLEEESGETHRHWAHSRDAEKHLASLPWDPEPEIHIKEASCLLWQQTSACVDVHTPHRWHHTPGEEGTTCFSRTLTRNRSHFYHNDGKSKHTTKHHRTDVNKLPFFNHGQQRKNNSGKKKETENDKEKVRGVDKFT